MIAAVLRGRRARRPSTTGPGRTCTGESRRRSSSSAGDEGLFEVDEAWLPRVAEQLEPRLLVLGNLFRDQLDRYGELERARRRVGRAGRRARRAQPGSPQRRRSAVADLGRDRELRPPRRASPTSGSRTRSQALPELQHAHDAKHCRRCGAPYAYERAFVGHLGHYTCPNCDADRPAPDVAATKIELRGMTGSRCRGADPEGDARARAFPSPASTTSTTRWRPSPPALRLGRGARTQIAPGSESMRGGLRPRRDDRGRRRAGLDPADQEPGRRQRGAADAAARGRDARRRRRASTSGSR